MLMGGTEARNERELWPRSGMNAEKISDGFLLGMWSNAAWNDDLQLSKIMCNQIIVFMAVLTLKNFALSIYNYLYIYKLINIH